MNRAIKQKWVKALMSGQYKQGYGRLKANNGYCCLGILVKECGGVTNLGDALLDVPDFITFGLAAEDQMGLAAINDSGVPFEMIAGLINEAL